MSHSSDKLKKALEHQAVRREALAKGDVPGHEFHGNQYSGGAGASSQNEGYGYHGEAYAARVATGTKDEHANEQAHQDFKARTERLVAEGHFKTTAEARDFLDSRAGRHYADQLVSGGNRGIHDTPTNAGARAVIQDYKSKGFGRAPITEHSRFNAVSSRDAKVYDAVTQGRVGDARRILEGKK